MNSKDYNDISNSIESDEEPTIKRNTNPIKILSTLSKDLNKDEEDYSKMLGRKKYKDNSIESDEEPTIKRNTRPIKNPTFTTLSEDFLINGFTSNNFERLMNTTNDSNIPFKKYSTEDMQKKSSGHSSDRSI